MADRPLIVQKYGGSSLSSPAHIRNIAARIAKRADNQQRIIVTVSAMGSSTDELLRLATEITPNPPQRELDMLLTVGERISMALLAMALDSLGCRAISFTGSQSGIVTNISHTRALIEEIRAERIENALSAGNVVIVAGFQGVSRAKEITTLGRGGSDTTAVALAATLDADRCEICSDFPGVFTADPRRVPGARRIPRLSYDEMLELAALGAKVLHFRAAEMARRYQVPLYLLSSTEVSDGTHVDSTPAMEKANAQSITCNPDIVHVCMTETAGAGHLDGVLAQIGETDANIVGYQKTSEPDRTTLAMTIDKDDYERLRSIFEGSTGLNVKSRDDLASVSVIGSGYAASTRAVVQIELLLAGAGIAIHSVDTSSLSITCLIPKQACEQAVTTLHAALFPAE